jgi:tetratricopeptide (TPR) repeat protein
MKKQLLFISLILFVLPKLAIAGAQDANAFLSVGPGAPAAAMAESYAGIAEGAFGAAYNPAGLAKIPGITLGLQHNEWFAEMRMEYLSAIMPFGPGGLYTSLNYISYGALEVRGDDGYLTGENFEPFDIAFSTGYGWEVVPNWLVGTTVTLTQGYIQDFNDTGVGISLGGIWQSPWKGISFATVFKNVGTNFSGYSWPIRAVVAVSSQDSLTSGLDANLEVDLPLSSGYTEMAFGAEYTLMRTIAFRAGYRYAIGEGEASLAGLSLGMGVELSRFDVSYAMRPMGDFGLTHRVSVSYAFPPMLAPLGQIEEKALIHFKKGKQLERKLDWLGALIEFRTALSMQPDWTEVDAALRRVNLKLQAAREKQRKAKAARAKETKPNKEDVASERQMKKAIWKHVAKGKKYLEQKAFKKSEQEWLIILEFDPGYSVAKRYLRKTKRALKAETKRLHGLALKARKKKDTETEMNYWQQALELDPNDQVAKENIWMGMMSAPVVSPEKKKEKKKKLKW